MARETRIQKVLSENGIVSRRKAEELIKQGKIQVNGHPAVLGQKIDPVKDLITMDGQRVYLERATHKMYIMLNKPRGYVTTMSDELGRRCIKELIDDVPERVYPIGRLDKDSEGLLLLTNDGDFANFIMHPSHHVSKTYRVTVRPSISDEQLVQLSSGVEVDGRMTAPAVIHVLEKQPGRVVLQMVIHEGRNRQIRKMCEAVGLEVARLKRTTVGPVKLGMLQPGEWRELKPSEVGMIRNAVKNTVQEKPEKQKVPGNNPQPENKGKSFAGREGKGSFGGKNFGRPANKGRVSGAKRAYKAPSGNRKG